MLTSCCLRAVALLLLLLTYCPSPIIYLPIALLRRCLVLFLFRVRELLAARMVVQKFLPFNFFSSGTTWQELIGTVTAKDTPFPPLTSRRVKHLLVEMFVATKKVSVGLRPALSSLCIFIFSHLSAFPPLSFPPSFSSLPYFLSAFRYAVLLFF